MILIRKESRKVIGLYRAVLKQHLCSLRFRQKNRPGVQAGAILNYYSHCKIQILFRSLKEFFRFNHNAVLIADHQDI